MGPSPLRRTVWLREQTLELECQGLNPSAATSKPWEPGQVTRPLCASVSSSVYAGSNSACPTELW